MLYSARSVWGFIVLCLSLCGMIPKKPYAESTYIKTYKKAMNKYLASKYLRLVNTGVHDGEKFVTTNLRTKDSAAEWGSLDPALATHMDMITAGRKRPKSDADRQRRYKRYMTNWHFLSLYAGIDRIRIGIDFGNPVSKTGGRPYAIADPSRAFVDANNRIIPFSLEEDLRIPYPCFFSTIFLKKTEDANLYDALRYTRSMGLYVANSNLYSVYFLVSPKWEEYNVKGSRSVMPDVVRDQLASIVKDKNREIKSTGGKYNRVGYYYGCEKQISEVVQAYADNHDFAFACPLILVPSKNEIADVIRRPEKVRKHGKQRRKESACKLVPAVLGFPSHIIVPMDADGVITTVIVTQYQWRNLLKNAARQSGLIDTFAAAPYDGKKDGVNVVEIISCDYGKLETCMQTAFAQNEELLIVGLGYQESIIKEAYPQYTFPFRGISKELFDDVFLPAFTREMGMEDLSGKASDDDYPF
jgi:hypothetical protein